MCHKLADEINICLQCIPLNPTLSASLHNTAFSLHFSTSYGPTAHYITLWVSVLYGSTHTHTHSYTIIVCLRLETGHHGIWDKGWKSAGCFIINYSLPDLAPLLCPSPANLPLRWNEQSSADSKWMPEKWISEETGLDDRLRRLIPNRRACVDSVNW